MAGRTVICEHKRLWTTCPQCGKEIIEAAKTAPKAGEEDFSTATPRFRAKAVGAPAEEPEAKEPVEEEF